MAFKLHTMLCTYMYIVFMAFLIVSQKSSNRLASDSASPPQHSQGISMCYTIATLCMYVHCLEQFTYSHSFPDDSHPNKAHYQNCQQSDDDIMRKSVYSTSHISILEENSGWSLSVNLVCS